MLGSTMRGDDGERGPGFGDLLSCSQEGRFSQSVQAEERDRQKLDVGLGVYVVQCVRRRVDIHSLREQTADLVSAWHCLTFNVDSIGKACRFD